MSKLQGKQSTSVLYGDEICLSELDIGGIVCADADVTMAVFLDREAIFLPGHATHQQQLCQFKVLPKFQYSATKAFRKRLQKSQLKQKLDASNWATKLDPSDPLYKDLARDKKQIDDEQATNEMEAARTVGLHVAFGSVVQLKHVRSNRFLTQTKNRAALDKLAMEVALIADGNEGSWWKVLPAEKVRSLGDHVRDCDKIKLQNVKFQDSYLFVSTSQPFCTRGVQADDDEWNNIPSLQRLSTVHISANQREDIGTVLLHPSCNARFEVNAFPGSSSFQVAVFKAGQGKFSSADSRPDADGQRFVDGSAVVTLYLREDDCFLAYNAVDDRVEWLPSSAIAVEATMWRLCKKEVGMGGAPVQRQGSSLMLQHLATGKYLAVHEPVEWVPDRTPARVQSTPTSVGKEECGSMTFCLHMVDDLQSEQAVWSVRAFTEEEAEANGAVVDGEVVWLEHVVRQRGAGGKARGESQHLWLGHERKREGGVCAGFGAMCRSEESPPNSEVIEIRMVLSKDAKAVDYLARCTRALRGAEDVWGDYPQCPLEAFTDGTEQAREAIDRHPLKNIPLPVGEVVYRCLSQMILSCSKSGSTAPLKSDGPPVPEQQNRLRGVGVLHDAVHGLQLMLAKVPAQHVAREFPDVFRFLQLGFRLLQKGCQANEASKQLLIPHLEFFNFHASHDFGSFETAIEIYHDSVELLNVVDFSVATEVISKMMFVPQGKGRIVDIFSNICVCRGLPIAKNQNVCVDFLERYPNLTPTVEVCINDVLLLDESRGVKVSMCTLMNLPGGEQAVLDPAASSGNADANMYRFYLKVLDFLAGALEGRNAVTTQFFSEHRERYALGFDHLVNVISSSVYPASYRARCCKLLDKLYIDCDPHLMLQQMSMTQVWNKLHHDSEQSQEMAAAYGYLADTEGAKPECLRIIELKSLLLKLTREHARTNVEEMEVNRFVGSMVHLVHKLALFGFYHRQNAHIHDLKADMEAIKTMAVPMLRLLDGRSDFCAPFGSFSGDVARFEVSEKTVIVMEMKMEVIQVFRDLTSAVYTERQLEFFECWDRVLERKFGIKDWTSAKEAMHRPADDTAKKGKQVCSIAKALNFRVGATAHKPKPSRSPTNGVGSSSRVAPEADALQIEWTSEDVHEITDSLANRHPMLDDLAPAKLAGISGTNVLPEFFKVLLDLTRYKHKALKEVAIELIFLSFTQHSQVLSILKSTHFVCDPATYSLHFEIRDDALKLSRNIRHLPTVRAVEFDLAAMGQASEEAVPGLREQLLVDDDLEEERKGKLAEQERLRAEGFEVCFGILRKWSELCTRSHTKSERTRASSRRLLINHGVDRLLLSILQVPIEREPAVERRLDRMVDEQLRDLFGAVYELLGKLCDGETAMQENLLAHMDLHLSLARVEGLHVDAGLWAMLKGNPTEMMSQGQKLIEFFLTDMLEKYDHPSSRWVDLVRSLGSSRENAFLVHKLLSKPGAATARILGCHENEKEAVKAWDETIAALSRPASPLYEASMLRASMLDLLSAGCSGKQPSAEVFGASLVAWPVALRSVVGPDINFAGERVAVPPKAKYRLRGSYLRFMHKVYIETSVKRLLDEQAKADSGVWSFGDSKMPKCFSNCETLMECILGDLVLLVSKLGGNTHQSGVHAPASPGGPVQNGHSSTDASAVPVTGKAWEEGDELTWSVFEYVAGAMLPMLVDFYHGPEVAEAHPSAAVTSDKIHDVISKLLECPFPPDWERIEVMGEVVNMRRRCWEALRAMSNDARVRQEWGRHPKNQNFKPHKVTGADNTADDEVEKALQATKTAMLDQISLDLRVSQNVMRGDTASVGLGMRQLALIMNKDEEVSMYDQETFEDLGLPVPPAPQYEDFIISMLEICHDHSTKEEVLMNVLQLMRCSIYVVEPHADNEEKIAEQQWEAFLSQSAVEKISEPADETLTWLQEKFDGMGATTAALRLVSHPNLMVQVEAVLLLLVLLQGGNRQVQNTVAVYLTRRRDRNFFKAIRDVLDHSKVALKDFKRMIKAMKSAQLQGDQTGSATMRGFMTQQRQASVGFRSATALLNTQLRLCQLLCEGQYRPFQRMMHKQPWLPSYDLLEGCLELFENTHPLIPDTLMLNDGDTTALALQMIETISEAIQGPHRVNQQVVLSSNFLAGCNRILSALVYTPLHDDQPPAQFERFDVQVSVSDLKSWVKSDVLKCTLALFEACNNGRIPRLMQEFFELKKVVSQMVMIGRIIGLADPVEHQEHGLDDDDANLGFGSIVGGSVGAGAFGSIKAGSSGAAGNGNTSSRRGSQAFGSFAGQPTAFTRGGNASARQVLVSSLKFSEGYEETLRGELFSLYFLLMNFNEFDDTGRVKEELAALRRDHPVLYTFLHSHTFEVELVRQHAGSLEPQAEKVFFSVNTDVLEVINGSNYQEQAQEELFAVPRKNPTEKARALLSKLKKQLSRLMWVVTLARSSQWRRFVIRHRDAFEEVPLLLSLLMTFLFLAVYAVPVDPHTKQVLGGGGFYGYDMETPGYETAEPYPFAEETSDPSGLGATINSVIWGTDPASKLHLELKTRWDSSKEWDFWPPARILAMIMTTLHLALTTVNITAHLFHEFPLIVWDAWEQYIKEVDGQTMSISNEKVENVDKLRPVRQGKAFLKSMRKAPTVRRRQIGFRFYMHLFRNSWLLVYFAFMALVSLLAWVMSPFFHVLYLLDFFRRKSGRLVTRSLVLGAPNLLRSFWLGIVVLVCFGFMSYNYFSDTINANQQMCRTPYQVYTNVMTRTWGSKAAEMRTVVLVVICCLLLTVSVFQCVVKHLLDSMTGDLTTVLGNDLGVFAFPPMVVWADLWEQFRSTYVFVSLIFWVFLLQGIIQGQIIDAFAEMRNRADALEEDLEQKCFVSSVDRFVFNAYPGEWEKRRGGKYVFNYLLFFAHLMQKDPEDMNGLDHAVHKQYEEDVIDFMPIETFVAREREREEAHKDDEHTFAHSVAEDVKRIEQQLSSLKSAVDTVLQRLPPSAAHDHHRASIVSQHSGPTSNPLPEHVPSLLRSGNTGRTEA